MTLLVAVGAAALIAAPARAQVYSPPSYYAPDELSQQQSVKDPYAILEQDPSTFTVPIPGGGDIQVQGPASEPGYPSPMSPIENWAVQRNNPFSIGGVPIGPAPAQR